MIDRSVMLGGAAAQPFELPFVLDAPTRVSTIKGDVGYVAMATLWADNRGVKVFLDGVEQPWADAADSVAGWVRRVVRSPEVNPVLDGDEFMTEVVHGRVTIVPVKRA